MGSWGASGVFLTLAELNDMKRNRVSSSHVISTCHLQLIVRGSCTFLTVFELCQGIYAYPVLMMMSQVNEVAGGSKGLRKSTEQ